MLRDPGAAERGTLFHDIVRRFTESRQPTRLPPMRRKRWSRPATRRILDAVALPADIEAVWWPRFSQLGARTSWSGKREPARRGAARLAEARAEAAGDRRHRDQRCRAMPTASTSLPAGRADILDYKTGSSPSKAQAHTLLAPQLALEALC